jgi:hypothetical protein
VLTIHFADAALRRYFHLPANIINNVNFLLPLLYCIITCCLYLYLYVPVPLRYISFLRALWLLVFSNQRRPFKVDPPDARDLRRGAEYYIIPYRTCIIPAKAKGPNKSKLWF